jgi:arylsulfatase A-like enzyme
MKKYMLLGLCLGIAWGAGANESASPNVLVILADDLGYADLGFQGSTEIPTPHLDKLRASGIRFTDAHVSASVCSPSRAGMMTGRYQQQFGHEPNCPPQEFGMNLKEQTIADALKPLGYRTGLVGKWHLGDRDCFYPTNRGFDWFCGLREGSRSYFYDAKNDDKSGSPKAIELNGKPVKFEGYLTDFFTEKAVEFIEGQNAETPFFLFLSYTAPHAPMHATDEDLQRFKHIKNEKRRTYFAMVSAMDRGVGQVMDALEKTGASKNTLVFFLSDNGGPINHNASVNLPLNGEKGIKFEGGIRVPFVMSWPGQLPANATYEPMVSSLDILPTVLTAAGGTPDYGHLAGRDLVPFLKGTDKGVPHQNLYWHKEWFSAVRDGDWKLLYVQDFGYALYNLKDDLGEKHNVAKQHPERLEQMRRDLDAWKAKGTGSEWTEGPKWYRINRQLHIDLIEEGTQVPAK